MKEKFTEIIKFLESENVKCSFNEEYEDTIKFRSYGSSYSIRYDDKSEGFIFCCQLYQDVSSLIEAMNKKCRGGDGKF